MTSITSKMPQSWQELEEMVAAILLECGMDSKRAVTLKIPRGTIDIDVVAKEENDGIESTVICECKNWAYNIPKEIVNAFRTVMIEIGANRGYIVSRVGFQSGAYEAAEATNISLVTFQEFQERYFVKWYKKRLWQIEHNTGDFNVYYEPLGRPGYHLLTDDEDRTRYDLVWEKYAYAGLLLTRFSPWSGITRALEPPVLPIAVQKMEEGGVSVPDEIKVMTGYRELLAALEAAAAEGLEELRKVNPITRDKSPSEIDRDS